MKKIVFANIFIFFLVSVFAQNDTNEKLLYVSLPLLEVKKDIVYQLLDTLIFYNDNCMYTRKAVPYYFETCVWNKKERCDTLTISLASCQYDCFFMKCNPDYYQGFFYYKGNIVLVSSIDTVVFHRTNICKPIYCKSDGTIYQSTCHFLDEIRIVYDCINDSLIFRNKWLCQPESPFYIKIYRGIYPDSWEEIMREYCVTKEDLKKMNPEKKLNFRKNPKEFSVIRIY